MEPARNTATRVPESSAATPIRVLPTGVEPMNAVVYTLMTRPRSGAGGAI
jgi:hypothetical protein